LDSVLTRLPKQSDPNVLVGFETADDAGVYRLPGEAGANLALVQTVDFFTPIVDDPFTFGQIAAANSLSDIYAMGGRPLTALSIVGFPNSGKNIESLEQIMRGGLAKMQEAGCTVIGGHSIGDEEIKFGYAITGLVHPDRVLSNSAARAGDVLILTKRLGTGVIGTAIKKGRVNEESARAAIDSMSLLNRAAGEAALKHKVHSATDITGFGLLGHAREMAAGSKTSIIIDSSQVVFLPGALDYAAEGLLPGGLRRNIEFVSGCVEFADGVPEPVRNLLFDPQTSGGLLLSVAPADAPHLIHDLEAGDAVCRQIGLVVEKTQPLISVR
jgi:selenide,water dikinase